MDKKSIGNALIRMREQDEVRFIDIENNKEYGVYECFYHYDNAANKQVIEFHIKGKEKHDGSK